MIDGMSKVGWSSNFEQLGLDDADDYTVWCLVEASETAHFDLNLCVNFAVIRNIEGQYDLNTHDLNTQDLMSEAVLLRL